MISSFSKKVLIEQAKLDRLQQRQLREHLVKLQAMVRFLNKMSDIIANKKLTAEERSNSIYGLHNYFDKLNKKIILLSGAILTPVAFEALPAARFEQFKLLSANNIRLEIDLEKEEHEQKVLDVL